MRAMFTDQLVVITLGIASLAVSVMFAWLAPWARRPRVRR